MRYVRILALVALCLAYAPTPALAVTGYDSAYSGESAFVNVNPGETAAFQVFFSNTGSLTWTKGGDTQVDLAACLADKVTCPAQDPADATWNSGWLSATRYATTTQATVAPGTLATFAYNIKAPADATGTHRFNGDLVVASSGARIHPQGYYQDATVPAIGSTGPTPTPTPQPPVVVPPPVNQTADLSITKSDSPDPVNPGTNLTYTLTAANAGPYNAVNATISDALPAGTKFVSFSAPAGWTSTTPAAGGTGLVTSMTPNFTFNTNATFTLVVSVDQMETPATLSNTATITSGTTDPNANNNAATATTAVRSGADLSVSKSDGTDPVLAGFNETYTISASNAGPNDAQAVAISDIVPSGTTFVSFEQTSGPTFTATTPAAGGTGTVSATRTTFAAGANATFALVVKVNPGTTGSITNTATISSTTADSNTSNNSSSATTTVNTQSLLCTDGTTDTLSGQTGDQIYGGTCTLTGPRSATLNNIPPGPNGAYSGVYFDPSALAGESLGSITTLSFNYVGSVLQASGPRFSVPIDTNGDGATDFYAFIDALYCNDGAGLVDAIHDSSCTIYWTGGPSEGAANWAAFVAANPGARIANSIPFIVADGPGAWDISNVHMGN